LKLRQIYESLILERNIKTGDLVFYEVGTHGTLVAYDVEKKMSNLGNRNPMFTVDESANGYEIRGAWIPENLQRKGISTKFFQFMNNESKKKTKKPLKLSNDLSSDGKQLIQGLISKGMVHELDGQYFFK